CREDGHPTPGPSERCAGTLHPIQALRGVLIVFAAHRAELDRAKFFRRLASDRQWRLGVGAAFSRVRIGNAPGIGRAFYAPDLIGRDFAGTAAAHTIGDGEGRVARGGEAEYTVAEPDTVGVVAAVVHLHGPIGIERDAR